MSEADVENWMHASDEERMEIQAAWNLDNDEGKEVIAAVASLFKDECVYNVVEVGVDKNDTRWFIKSYVESEDFETLKERTNVQFLGFPIRFYNQLDLPA